MRKPACGTTLELFPDDNVGVLVDCALYSDGKREPVGMAEAVRAAPGVPGGFVWLGLHEPTYDAVMLGLDLTLYRLFRRSGWL